MIFFLKKGSSKEIFIFWKRGKKVEEVMIFWIFKNFGKCGKNKFRRGV